MPFSSDSTQATVTIKQLNAEVANARAAAEIKVLDGNPTGTRRIKSSDRKLLAKNDQPEVTASEELQMATRIGKKTIPKVENKKPPTTKKLSQGRVRRQDTRQEPTCKTLMPKSLSEKSDDKVAGRIMISTESFVSIKDIQLAEAKNHRVKAADLLMVKRFG